MSKLSRYNLLISLIRHELRSEHILLSSGNPKHNQMLYGRSVEGWIFLLEDIMCENLVCDQARDTRIRNLICTLNNHDASFTFPLLKKIYDILIDHISGKWIITDYQAFKGLFSDSENVILGYLCSPIKESLYSVLQSQTVVRSGCYRNTSSVDMKRCSAALLFLSKVNFIEVGLEAKGLKSYYFDELETSYFQFSSSDPISLALRNIITEWLKDWSYDGSDSSHGPGSVADSDRHKISKYLNFRVDQPILDLFDNNIELVSSLLPFGGLTRTLKRTSKLVFVPKNITKLRSISMEPVTLQYLQQGCMRSLYNYFDHHIELRKHLKLKDQHQNKSFAYSGSITNDYATIDLSHASDSVNWKLVTFLFGDVPQLLKWLECTRSTHTLLPDGNELRLSKFAPMGSALCFPIESIIFAAIAKLSILISREECRDRDNVTGIRNSIRMYTVYGDDIIIPSYAANKCIELLGIFGFQPNNEKSYLTGPFKESCGGNFFCGLDITALKFAPAFNTSFKLGVSPEAYTALCSYANLAYERGYSLFRLFCIKLIFESGRKPLFSNSLDHAPAIYSPCATNFHLRKFYSKRYQKYQVEYTSTKTVDKAEFVLPSTGEIETSLEPLEHILLHDYLYNHNEERKDATSLNQLNAKIMDSCIIFDVQERYNRKSLLPQVFKYTLCRSDCD